MPKLNSLHVIELLKKEFRLEFRQRTAIASILLYVLSVVFIGFLSFKSGIRPDVWGALFWIVVFFAAINAAAKSFFSENRHKALYNYSLYAASDFVLAKIVYNTLLVWLVSFCGVFCFGWMISFPVQNMLLFVLTLALGGLALAGALSLMSCIAAKVGNSYAVMSLLSMPACIPVLLISLRLTRHAIDGLDWSVSLSYLGALALVDLIIISLSYFLFRYLWKE